VLTQQEVYNDVIIIDSLSKLFPNNSENLGR